jgi:hypothetical protein
LGTLTIGFAGFIPEIMIQALKTYDKSFAEGMLVRTFFYLDEDPVLQSLKPVENEGAIRDNVINVKKFMDLCEKDEKRIAETVKKPDMAYDLGSNYSASK